MIMLIQTSNILLSVLNFGFFLSVILLTINFAEQALSGDFVNNVDLSQVSKEWVKIQTKENNILHAAIYREKILNKLEKRPYIIVAHGANDSVEGMEWVSVALCVAGFHVLAFNQTGHGRKPHRNSGNGKDYTKVMVNVHEVVNYTKNLPDLLFREDIPQIGFVGHSTGGLMALTQAYLNSDIQITIALSQIHNFMDAATRSAPIFSSQWWFKIGLKLVRMRLDYNEAENHIISPAHCLHPDPSNNTRVFMIHAIDDPLPIEDAYKNRDLAQLPPENCFFLEKGGHNFRCQESLVIGKLISWLTTKFFK
jgi:pimeloyl-ACP methyl ester carboxylesterase